MKLFTIAVSSILLLAACSDQDNAHAAANNGLNWQVEVPGKAKFGGQTVVAVGGGPYKVYRLSNGDQGVTIRATGNSHSISIEDKAAALSCDGSTSLELQDDVHAVFEGKVKCGDTADLPVNGAFTLRK